MSETLIIILVILSSLFLYLIGCRIVKKFLYKKNKGVKDLYTISFIENNVKYTKIRDKDITYYIYSLKIGDYNYIFSFNKAAEQATRRTAYDFLNKNYDESCGLMKNINDVKIEREVFINSYGYFSFHTYTDYYGNIFHKIPYDVWNIKHLIGEIRYEGEWYPFSFNTENIEGNFSKVINQFNEYIRILETKDEILIKDKIKNMFIS